MRFTTQITIQKADDGGYFISSNTDVPNQNEKLIAKDPDDLKTKLTGLIGRIATAEKAEKEKK